jgi:hypothetical protein
MGEAGAKDSLSIADMSDQASVTFCGEFGVRASVVHSLTGLAVCEVRFADTPQLFIILQP